MYVRYIAKVKERNNLYFNENKQRLKGPHGYDKQICRSLILFSYLSENKSTENVSMGEVFFEKIVEKKIVEKNDDSSQFPRFRIARKESKETFTFNFWIRNNPGEIFI